MSNLDKLKDLQKIQFDSVTFDSYMQGLYNGMELAIATMENRPPMYLDSNGKHDPEDIIQYPEYFV